MNSDETPSDGHSSRRGDDPPTVPGEAASAPADATTVPKPAAGVPDAGGRPLSDAGRESGDAGAVSGDASGPGTQLAGGRIYRRRLILVDVLIGVTTVLAVVGMFAVYANRLLFNPDNWANTSTQLLQNSQIRSAMANYLVEAVYENENVPALLKSGLPPQF